MSKSYLVQQSKKQLTQKLQNVVEEEKNILSLVQDISKEVKEECEILLAENRKSKFLKEYHKVSKKLDDALMLLFKLKVSVLSDGDDSSDSETDEEEDCDVKSTLTEEIVTTRERTFSRDDKTVPVNQKDQTAENKVCVEKTTTFTSCTDDSEIKSNDSVALPKQVETVDEISCGDLRSNSEVSSSPKSSVNKFAEDALQSSFEKRSSNSSSISPGVRIPDLRDVETDNIANHCIPVSPGDASVVSNTTSICNRSCVSNETEKPVHRIQSQVIKPGTVLRSVYISEMKSPCIFWIQRYCNDVECLENKVLQHGTNSKEKFTEIPTPGTYCCAQSTIDDSWYRCQILDVKHFKSDFIAESDYFVHVYCVDNGKTELGISSTKIKPLSEDLFEIPAQAICCNLSSIKSKTKNWEPGDCVAFSQLAMLKELTAEFTHSGNCLIYPVVLYTNKSPKFNIACELVKCGSAFCDNSNHTKKEKVENVSEIETKKQNKVATNDKELNGVAKPNVVSNTSEEMVETFSTLQDNQMIVKAADYVETFHPNADLTNFVWSADIKDLIFKTDMNLYVMMSHVIDPYEFYFNLINEDVHEIDELQNMLNELYDTISATPSKEQVMEGSCWVCRYLVDSHWYRVRIVGIDQDNGFLALFVDFGNTAFVTLQDLKPLMPNFLAFPAFAVRASMFGLQPYKNDDTSIWSMAAVERFKMLVRLENALQLLIIPNYDSSGDTHCRRTKNALIWNSDNECVNSIMLKEKLAWSKFVPDEISGVEDNNEIDSNWDPMAEDYYSEMNTYQTDFDDPGVAICGYKVKNKTVCRQFAERGRCTKKFCHYEHITDEEAMVPNVNNLTYTNSKPMNLPCLGSMVAVYVTKSINPIHFYVVLPYGPKPHASLQKMRTGVDHNWNKFEDVENLDVFVKELNNFYEKRPFHGDRSLHLAVGSVMAVKSLNFENKWCRARIVEVDTVTKTVEVFFVDNGNTGCALLREIQELDGRFLHFPFQAVECFLADVELAEEQWTNQAMSDFQNLVDRKILIAQILFKNDNTMYVHLYDTLSKSGENKNISDELVKLKHAKNVTQSSERIMLKKSSQFQMTEEIIYLPG